MSWLVINNGVLVADPDEFSDSVIKNYGTLELNNVEVQTGRNVVEIVNNRGDLTLSGKTSIATGKDDGGVAIKNQPLWREYFDISEVSCWSK